VPRLDWADRDTRSGSLIAALMVVSLALGGAAGPARWPWAGLVLVAALPYAALLLPEFRFALRSWVLKHPRAPGMAVAALAAYGLLATLVAGSSAWYNLLLWPVCCALALGALGPGGSAEPAPGRILASALGLWVLAGVWDATLRIHTPGGRHVSLAFVAAVDLGLFIYLVARPLGSFRIGFGLDRKDLTAVLVAVLLLLALAVPAGLAIGFLRLESKWAGIAPAAARLFGLILFVGLPEELLFRGLLQEAFSRLWTARAGLLVASAVFGASHIVKRPAPNWEYALLATCAGLAYGWVYQRTGKLSAAGLTHGGVDWIWSTFLHT
jgi:membrane protease YdiL (CAAX protease family)